MGAMPALQLGNARLKLRLGMLMIGMFLSCNAAHTFPDIAKQNIDPIKGIWKEKKMHMERKENTVGFQTQGEEKLSEAFRLSDSKWEKDESYNHPTRFRVRATFQKRLDGHWFQRCWVHVRLLSMPKATRNALQ